MDTTASRAQTAINAMLRARSFPLGVACIVAGVVLHLPEYVMAAGDGYRMAGMPISTTMLFGMALIAFGFVVCVRALIRLPAGSLPVVRSVVRDGPLTRRHIRLAAVLVIALALDVMKPFTIGFVLPGMITEYGLSIPRAALLPIVALTGTTVGSVAWGVLADRTGRRGAMLLSALLFIGTAICGTMPTFELNLLMCFIMGASVGGLLPLTFALLSEMVPAAQRGWLTIAVGAIGTTCGYLLASAAAAILEPEFTWRALWLIGLPTGVALIALSGYIPESPRFLLGIGEPQAAVTILGSYGNVAILGITPTMGFLVHTYGFTAAWAFVAVLIGVVLPACP